MSGSNDDQSRYSTDTRTLRPGDTYVAIRGEVHDGHAFVDAAVEAGATTVIVDHQIETPVAPTGEPVAVLVVENTIGHLTTEASRRLAETGATVIGITGSVGKTTTRSVIQAVLAEAFPVVAATGNLNTPLGLSLLVLNADLTPDTKIVMEMGARFTGDIAELTTLFPPTVAVLTNVKGVHLETFGTIDDVAAEKGELVAAIAADGTAVLNADDERVAAMAARTTGSILRYGTGPDVDIAADDVTAELPILGDHAVLTAQAAIGVARALGMTDAAANRGLTRIRPEPGRLARLAGVNGSVLVDDTYNASPDATVAALDVVAELAAEQRVAYLGDMLELGTDEVAGHRRALEHALDRVDRVIAVGERMAAAADELGSGRERITTVATSDQVVEQLASGALPRPTVGTVVLVKGSQGMRMERVSEALLDPDLDPATVLCRQSTSWKQI